MTEKSRRERGEEMIKDVYAGEVVVPDLSHVQRCHHAGDLARARGYVIR